MGGGLGGRAGGGGRADGLIDDRKRAVRGVDRAHTVAIVDWERGFHRLDGGGKVRLKRGKRLRVSGKPHGAAMLAGGARSLGRCATNDDGEKDESDEKAIQFH